MALGERVEPFVHAGDRVEGDLHQPFGLRPGNEHAGGHEQRKIHELLLAGEVLERRAGAALAQRSPVEPGRGRVQSVGPRVEPRAVGPQQVHEQRFGRCSGTLDSVRF